MRGMLGPQRSTSSMPTRLPARENANASCEATVDLPTPPLPDMTTNTCLMCAIRSRMASDVPPVAIVCRWRCGVDVAMAASNRLAIDHRRGASRSRSFVCCLARCRIITIETLASLLEHHNHNHNNNNHHP